MFRGTTTILALILVSGCATITRGTEEAYAIQTDPAGAMATLSNGLSCTTPCSLKLKRRGDFTVTLEKEGYETVTATVTSSIDGAGGAGMAGNVLLGGIIGAGVDAGSGAMHSHKPNPLDVKLTKLVTEAAGEKQTVSVAEADRYESLMKLNDLKEKGIISEEEFAVEKAKLLGPAAESADQ